MSKHRFPYKWQKTDLGKVKKHNRKVFSTFACGGGSSFGYKMAGFDVVGCNEIDPEMMALYTANHHPLYTFLGPIQEFKGREDLPKELFDLDILDGSPPCSTFSMAGSREKTWGKEKRFREGQAKQVLSDLFFDYLDLAEKLQPKICVAENVKGLLIGKAKGYCKLIKNRFNEIGYDAQLFLLNSNAMGVPQSRERVFFIARRRDLRLQPLTLSFDEDPIFLREVLESLPFQDLDGTELNPTHNAFWDKVKPGQGYDVVANGNYFSERRLANDAVCPTICSSSIGKFAHPFEKRFLSWVELLLIGSYPYDYDFLGKSKEMKGYCVGMSVPPVMTANIAAQIAQQWLNVDENQIDEGWQ